jgi:hypothetical protein
VKPTRTTGCAVNKHHHGATTSNVGGDNDRNGQVPIGGSIPPCETRQTPRDPRQQRLDDRLLVAGLWMFLRDDKKGER